MDSNIPPIQQTPEYRDFIKEFVAKKENVKHKLTSEINFHVDDLFQGMLTKFNSILRNSLPVPNGTSPSATTTTTTTAATTNEPISVPILTPIPSYSVPSSTLQVVGASSIVPPGLLAGVYNNQNYNPQSALNLQQRQQQLLNPQLNQQLNQQLTQQSSQQTGQQLQHQQQQQNQQTSQQTSQQASQLLHPQPSQLLHQHQSILPQYYSNSSIAALNSMTNSGLSIPSLDEPASTISITRYQGDSQFFSATLDASNMLQIELKDESSNGGANDDLNIEDSLVLLNEDIESWELNVSDSECECEECTKRELQLGPKKKLTKKSARKYQKKDSMDGSDGGTSSSSNGSSKVKIVRTMHVKCGQESCGDMFPHRSHLLVHAKQMHGIAPFRCLQGDCRQSFDTQISLDSHLEQSHSQTPEWFCIVCASFFKTYARLHAHEHNHHQRGMFRCSTCDFIGDLRSEVYEHYFSRHQSSTSGPNQNNQSSNISKFNCRHPTCGKCFNRRENFQRHERVHLGIKPYLCRWPECCYASENSHAVIDHIRKKHFNQPKTKKDRIANNVEDGREPRQFLEVRRELVNASYHERIAVKVFGNHITKYF